MKPEDRKAFTLLELLVVMAILALLLTILLPSLAQTHELARRTACSANLHGLGYALYLYAQTPPYVFPAIAQTYENDTSPNMYLFYYGHRTSAPSTTGIPSPTVDLWALIRLNSTVPAQFLCPSTKDVPDPAQDTSAYYDFNGPANLSFGYQYQHDPNCRPIGTTSEPTFPVMADANPYLKGGVSPASFATDRTSQFRGNSVNHSNREGQNVLFQGGFILFEHGPDVGLAGKATTGLTISRGRDHCYTPHLNTTSATVDYGLQPPGPLPPPPGSTAINCNLGSKSDACLVP